MPFAGLEKQAAAVRAAWQAWRGAEQARAEAEAAAAAARRDEDFLRHAVKELKALSPKADDEEKLAAERQMLRAGSRAGRSGGPGAGRAGGTAAARSQRCAPRTVWSSAASTRPSGRLDASLAALDRALSEATEAQAQLEAARDALEFDPAGWRRSRSGCSRCAPLARKHNVTVPELAPLAEKMASRLDGAG